MSELKQLGQLIAQNRRRLKLSQEDLAGLAEMDRSYLSEVENGHKNISVLALLKIARALEIDVRELLKDAS